MCKYIQDGRKNGIHIAVMQRKKGVFSKHVFLMGKENCERNYLESIQAGNKMKSSFD